MNKELELPTDHRIFDWERNWYFLFPNEPIFKKQLTTYPLCITLHDGCTIAHTHLPRGYTQLPVTAWIAHIVPDLAHSSLISIKQFCDARCRVEYNATNCYVYFNNKIILQGSRDEETKYGHYLLELLQNPLNQDTVTFPNLWWPDIAKMTPLTWLHHHSKTFGSIFNIMHMSTMEDWIMC